MNKGGKYLFYFAAPAYPVYPTNFQRAKNKITCPFAPARPNGQVIYLKKSLNGLTF
jgi:hypothetical protein